MRNVGYALHPFTTILCLIRSFLFGARVSSRPPNCCVIVHAALELKSLEASDINNIGKYLSSYIHLWSSVENIIFLVYFSLFGILSSNFDTFKIWKFRQTLNKFIHCTCGQYFSILVSRQLRGIGFWHLTNSFLRFLSWKFVHHWKRSKNSELK